VRAVVIAVPLFPIFVANRLLGIAPRRIAVFFLAVIFSFFIVTVRASVLPLPVIIGHLIVRQLRFDKVALQITTTTFPFPPTVFPLRARPL
jgi:hypothetical protein